MIRPLETGQGRIECRTGWLIRLIDDRQIAAYGDVAILPGWGTETHEKAGVWLASLHGRRNAEIPVPDSLPACRFALSHAERDLRSRPGEALQGKPGAALIPAGPDGISAMEQAAAAGFRFCKWKVGVESPEKEWTRWSELLERRPPDLRFRLDANGAWNPDLARRWIERCPPEAVEFIEQPLPAEDSDGLCELAEHSPIPLALDESLNRGNAFAFWSKRNWRGYWVLKPSLGHWIDTQYTVPPKRRVFSSALETPVGFRHALRTALSAPGSPAAIGFGIGPLFADAAVRLPAARPYWTPDTVEKDPGPSLWNHLSRP